MAVLAELNPLTTQGLAKVVDRQYPEFVRGDRSLEIIARLFKRLFCLDNEELDYP
jgi:hypothetical protein